MAFHASVRLSLPGDAGGVRPVVYSGGARRVALTADGASPLATPVVVDEAVVLKDDALQAAALRAAVGEVARLAASLPGGAALLARALSPHYAQAPPVAAAHMPPLLAECLLSALAAQAASATDDASALLAASYGYPTSSNNGSGGSSGAAGSAVRARRPSLVSSSSLASPTSPTTLSLLSKDASNTTTDATAAAAAAAADGAAAAVPHSGSSTNLAHIHAPGSSFSASVGGGLFARSSGSGAIAGSATSSPRAGGGVGGGAGAAAMPVVRAGLLQRYGGSGDAPSALSLVLPEVAWIEPPSPSCPLPCLCTAEGEGRLADAATGALIYQGNWRAGLRHGSGRATVVTPAAAARSAAVGAGGGGGCATATYDGDWRLGVRHGRGVLVDGAALTEGAGAGHGGVLVGPQADLGSVTASSTGGLPPLGGASASTHLLATSAAGGGSGAHGGGDRYDGAWAFDAKHGWGVEAQAGGGTYRGTWCSGAPHGTGVFTWPSPGAVGLGLGVSAAALAAAAGAGVGASASAAAAARSEYRQYHHGELVAVRPLLPSLGGGAAVTAAAGQGLLTAAPAGVAPVAGGATALVPTASMIHLPGAASHHTLADATAAGGAGGAAAAFSRVMSAGALAAQAAGGDAAGALVVPSAVAAGEGGGELPHHSIAASPEGEPAGLPLDHGVAHGGPATAVVPAGGQLVVLPAAAAAAGAAGGYQLAPAQMGYVLAAPGSAAASVAAAAASAAAHGMGLHTVPQVPQPLNAAVLRLLKHSTVNDVGGGKVRATGEVLTVDTGDSVESALTRMSEKNVLSVPVYDGGKARFVAVLHIMDICAFMLDLVAKKKASLSPAVGGGGAGGSPPGASSAATASIVAERAAAAAAASAERHGHGHGHGHHHREGSSSPRAGSSSTTPTPPATGVTPSRLNTTPGSPTLGATSAPGGGGGHSPTTSPAASSTLAGGAGGSSGGGGGPWPSSPPHLGGGGAGGGGGHHHSGSGGSGLAGGLREALAHQRRFATAHVSEVLAMRDHITSTAFKPLPSGAPLLFAAQSLAERRTHAVPIVDPLSGRLVRMLTQADVIRFIAAHLDELGPLGTMSVGELGLVDAAAAAAGSGVADDEASSSAHLVIARFSDRAFDILTAMRAHGAPAAPVVNAYGAIVANISFSDVKAVARRANFGALQLPIAAFLNAVDKPPEAINPSIYVKSATQLQSMVLTLAATKIHQLYAIDDALRPMGCVRISDILRLLTKEDEM